MLGGSLLDRLGEKADLRTVLGACGGEPERQQVM